ncbi:PucR family transcriptional regulator [Pseudonocardia bannensis]|uniref:PucR family transcriptional regulator n=1 Tax=Pseudonocardia bannensis TaxID=630973 RepID=A0A848DMN6_9PSEU|nr:PucR family transcriptional regulator [Pseudonocardia bannensis]NMH93815.1 PucR family transcriptional regulator [Pseudonocardia bannensis]
MSNLPTIADVVHAPGLRLECLAGTPADQPVDQVFVAEDLLDLRAAPPRTVAVLGAHVCAAVDSYQFDVALRLAAARGVVALVLGEEAARPPTSTSIDTAERFGVVILRPTEPVNLADLVCALDTALRGSAELALRRAVVAFEHVTLRRSADPEALVAEVAQTAAADIDLLDEPDGEIAFPVGLDEDAQRWIVVRDPSARTRPELALIGRLLATTLALAALAERRARELPIRSRAELLSELLDSSSRGRSELLRRARSMGLPIDGWHLVARIEFGDEGPLWSDEVAAFAAREELGRVALDAVRSSGTWHLARAERALLLVQMYRSDPGSTAAADATRVLQRALDQAIGTLSGAVLFCGVGSAHGGPTGLINSAAEARAAATAVRARGRANTATAFDGLGLRRTLVEWYASQTARNTVDTVLAPLDKMGPTKAAEAIRTLQAYLDNHGSLSRAAAELHLHRNSVAYRVERIFTELDVDPDNPDDWLLLQLACRARGLV